MANKENRKYVVLYPETPKIQKCITILINFKNEKKNYILIMSKITHILDAIELRLPILTVVIIFYKLHVIVWNRININKKVAYLENYLDWCVFMCFNINWAFY